MSFEESKNIEIPAKTWFKVSEVDLRFQIKAKWSTYIYYYEGTEDLSDDLNATAIRLKNPDPLRQEIAFLQDGRTSTDDNFSNQTFTQTQGFLWIYSEDKINILKDL